MKRWFLAAAVAGALSGCASEPTTDSGRVTFVALTNDPTCVKNNLLNAALSAGYEPRSSNDVMLVVEKPSNNALANALLSSDAYPTVNERLTFILAPTGRGVRVVIKQELVGNPGSAFEHTTLVKLPLSAQQMLEGPGGTPQGCIPLT